MLGEATETTKRSTISGNEQLRVARSSSRLDPNLRAYGQVPSLAEDDGLPVAVESVSDKIQSGLVVSACFPLLWLGLLSEPEHGSLF